LKLRTYLSPAKLVRRFVLLATLVVGAGLVGSQIIKCELDRGEPIFVFDSSPRVDALNDIFPVNQVKLVQGDVLKAEELNHLVRSEEIDTIYYTVAYPGFTITSMKNPSIAINVNVIGFTNILEAARLFDVKTVLFTSSNTVSTYVNPALDDVRFYNREYAYPRPSTIYAATKLASENFGLIYADSYAIDFRAVRLAAVFGPWRYGGSGGPSYLMHDLILRSLKGEQIEISFGDFEYIYSKDAGYGSVLACRTASVKDKIFNVGLGRFYTFKEIVQMIRELIPQAKISIGARSTQADEKKIYESMPKPILAEPLDLTRSREQLGYSPKYEMKDALKDYIQFFKSNKLV
jgi:nucleoside-diphosphate-sugar epimerase